MTTMSDTGTVSRVTSANGHERTNIIMVTPTTWVAEVMSCVALWLSVWESVSTSLVIRESTSPLA